MACLRDGVPVGVLDEQPPLRRRPQYRVLGLGRPVAWRDGYFFFESLNGPDAPRGDTVGDVLLSEAEAEAQVPPEPPADDYDARRRTYREVVNRRGQPAFRRDLLQAYRRSCAITGCSAEAVLEAAHLRPYRGLEHRYQRSAAARGHPHAARPCAPCHRPRQPNRQRLQTAGRDRVRGLGRRPANRAS